MPMATSVFARPTPLLAICAKRASSKSGNRKRPKTYARTSRRKNATAQTKSFCGPVSYFNPLSSSKRLSDRKAYRRGTTEFFEHPWCLLCLDQAGANVPNADLWVGHRFWHMVELTLVDLNKSKTGPKAPNCAADF